MLEVGLEVAEAHAEVVDALLGQVHRQAEHVAGRDGVEAVLVAEVVELHERADVVDADVGAAERDGLVLGTFAFDVVDAVEVAAGESALVAGALLDADLLERLRS